MRRLFAALLAILGVSAAPAAFADENRIFVFGGDASNGSAGFVDVNSIVIFGAMREMDVLMASPQRPAAGDSALFLAHIEVDCASNRSWIRRAQEFDASFKATSVGLSRIPPDQAELGPMDDDTLAVACGPKGGAPGARTFRTAIEAANWAWSR